MAKKEIVAKICLFGEASVGKTSLIRRFVLDQYDDRYLATIGAKVSKKVVTFHVPERELEAEITMMVWDIMGQKGFRKLLEEAYFVGATAAIGVCDITRKTTLLELKNWKQSIFGVTGPIPIVVFANKSDLKDRAEVTEDDLKAVATEYNAPYLYTSAKTGENVERGFQTLSKMLLPR